MKKLSLTLFVATVLLLSGCTSDLKKQTEMLVGTWKIDKISSDLIPTGSSTRITVNENNNSSGTVVLNKVDDVLTGTITVKFDLAAPAAQTYIVTGPITWLNDLTSVTTTCGTEGPVTWIASTNTATKQTWTYGGSTIAVRDAGPEQVGGLNIKLLEMTKQ